MNMRKTLRTYDAYSCFFHHSIKWDESTNFCKEITPQIVLAGLAPARTYESRSFSCFLLQLIQLTDCFNGRQLINSELLDLLNQGMLLGGEQRHLHD